MPNRKKLLINLSQETAKKFSNKRNIPNYNTVRSILEQIQRSGWGMIRHISYKELKEMKTENEANDWNNIIEESERLLKEKKISEHELPLFLGYLAREITCLKVSTVNKNSYKGKNQEKRSHKNRSSNNDNLLASKLKEALKKKKNN